MIFYRCFNPRPLIGPDLIGHCHLSLAPRVGSLAYDKAGHAFIEDALCAP